MSRRLAALGAIAAGILGAGLLVASPASAGTGWKTVTSWNGGLTRVCATPNGGGISTVSALWDGRGYPTRPGEFTNSGGGGLAHVAGDFTISGWTYSFADRGKVGPAISIQRPSRGWVYVLSGSAIGITVEAVVPVATLPLCPGRNRVAPVATSSAPVIADQQRAKKKCVTKREYRKIKKGIKPAKVKRIVGARGSAVTTAEFSQVRRYQRCGGGDVVVNFKRAGASKPLKVDSRYRH